MAATPQNSAAHDDIVVYQIVAARRMQWDTLLWQVPTLSLAAQAFLLTIALSSGSSRFSRLIASGLAVVAALLSLHLLARHRQAEITDAHWLADYEKRHFTVTAHGPEWAARRNATPVPGPLGALARIRAFPVWQAGLLLFGAAALATFLLALFHPSTIH